MLKESRQRLQRICSFQRYGEGAGSLEWKKKKELFEYDSLVSADGTKFGFRQDPYYIYVCGKVVFYVCPLIEFGFREKRLFRDY